MVKFRWGEVGHIEEKYEALKEKFCNPNGVLRGGEINVSYFDFRGGFNRVDGSLICISYPDPNLNGEEFIVVSGERIRYHTNIAGRKKETSGWTKIPITQIRDFEKISERLVA
jgi:hypothetical protein|tara:strand:- start:2747 stop:3085 length:339 start_codon:yes stop_codon:yes gene_type:complete